MNREKRKQRLELKPSLDKLEMRRMMSMAGGRARLVHELRSERLALGTQLADGDLDEYAQTLAQHPMMAANLGLGALSMSLRHHARYALGHGWGASLVSELMAHPRYAAAHHLMAAMTTPHSPSGASGTTTTQGALRRGHPRRRSITSPVLQDPQSVAVGGTLDVTLPNLGLGSIGPDVHHHAPAAAGQHDLQPRDRRARLRAGAGPGGRLGLLGRGLQRVARRARSCCRSPSPTPALVAPPRSPARSSTRTAIRWPACRSRSATSTAVTDSSGDFTLTGIAANPGPISAGRLGRHGARAGWT